VTGTGIVTGNGYNQTALDWNFSSQGNAVTTTPSWTFSASSLSVPDGGTTVLLLAPPFRHRDDQAEIVRLILSGPKYLTDPKAGRNPAFFFLRFRCCVLERFLTS